MLESAMSKFDSSAKPGVGVSRPPLPIPGWFFVPSLLFRAYNAVRRFLLNRTRPTSGFKELREIQERAIAPNDINEHLELIFAEAVLAKPSLILELGVRGGTATFVFEKVADTCSASIVSGDLDDCSSISSHPRWHFFQGDDIQFASEFQEFCRERNLTPSIDLLFIDTSHYYDHTRQEIEAWFPLLSPCAKVMFHDTNMKLVGPRKDGCFELSWDNDRGVIRAIEEYLGIRIDETQQVVEYSRGWLIRHTPSCNGLTILDRVSSDPQTVPDEIPMKTHSRSGA
jgi:cephalosporin hydroxylase